MQFKKIVLIVYILLGMINCSYAITEEGQTMIRYYRTFFTNYRHPMQGDGEIPPEDIDKYENYYKQETDEHGNIISFEKIIDRKCVFKMKYQYDSSGKLTKYLKQDCGKEK